MTEEQPEIKEEDDVLDDPIEEVGQEAAEPEAPEGNLPPRDESGRFTKREHSPHILQLASDLGISQAEIQSTDPDVLAGRVIERSRGLLAQRQQATPPQQEQEWGLDVDLSQYDDGIVKAFTKLADEVKTLRSKTSQTEARLLTQDQREQAQKGKAIDEALESFGEFFGKGPVTSMPANSVEAYRRHQAFNRAAQMAGGDPTPEQVVAAAQELFGIQQKAKGYGQSQTPTNRITPDQWNGGGLQKPTNRNGAKEPKGTKRAEKAVANMLRSMAIEDDGEEDFLE